MPAGTSDHVQTLADLYGHLRFTVLPPLHIVLAIWANVHVLLRKQGRDAVPGDMRSGVAVQQHDRASLPAVANAQRDVADIEVLEREALEQAQATPADRTRWILAFIVQDAAAEH